MRGPLIAYLYCWKNQYILGFEEAHVHLIILCHPVFSLKIFLRFVDQNQITAPICPKTAPAAK